MEAHNSIYVHRNGTQNTARGTKHLRTALIGYHGTKIPLLMQKAIITYKHVPRKLHFARQYKVAAVRNTE